MSSKHTWQTITSVHRDDITNTIQKIVDHQMQKQLNYQENTGDAAGINYQFTLVIENMDCYNDGVLQTAVLEGCYLTSVSYSGLDFSSSTVQTITLNVQYDNCTYIDMFPDNPDIISGDVVV